MKITPLKHVNVCLFRHPSLNVSPKNPPCKNFCDIWPIKLHFPKSLQRWEARVNERQSKCLPASLACLCPPDVCMLCAHLPLSWMLHRHKFLICWIGSNVPQYCSSKYLVQKCSLFTHPAYQVPNVSSVYFNNVLVYSWKHSGNKYCTFYTITCVLPMLFVFVAVMLLLLLFTLNDVVDKVVHFHSFILHTVYTKETLTLKSADTREFSTNCIIKLHTYILFYKQFYCLNIYHSQCLF